MTERPDPGDNVVRLMVGGLDGKLTTADGTPVPVRVFERSGGELMLVLMVLAGPELERELLTLDYASARGLVRFRGHGVYESKDVLRFRVGADPEVLQRREFVRVDLVRRVVLTREDGKELETHAIEISGGGMLLTGPESLKLEDRVGFSLHLGGGNIPVDGTGKVVRVEASGRRAVAIEEISHAHRQRLIRFIFQCQRDALAKGAQVAPLSQRRHRSEGLS